MEIPDGDTLDKGSRALERLLQPQIFSALLALVSLVGFGLLSYWDRQDRKEERAAQVKVLERIADHLGELTLDVGDMRLYLNLPPRRHTAARDNVRNASDRGE